jgi:hypothetical protein
MALFPRLSTGALAQYPLARSHEYRTRVIEYTDGTEQRISRGGRVLRRWTVSLDQLTEREAADVMTFFAQQRGRAQEFELEDPFTGTIVPNCRFEQEEVSLDFSDHGGVRTTLTIRGGE